MLSKQMPHSASSPALALRAHRSSPCEPQVGVAVELRYVHDMEVPARVPELAGALQEELAHCAGASVVVRAHGPQGWPGVAGGLHVVLPVLPHVCLAVKAKILLAKLSEGARLPVVRVCSLLLELKLLLLEVAT